MKLFEQAHDDGSIGGLMPAGQGELDLSDFARGRTEADDRPAVVETGLELHAIERSNEPCTACTAGLRHDAIGLGREGPADDRDPRLDDAGLLRSDRLQGVAELRLMIEVDRRDGRRDGRHDVGGVEAAAKPDFQHGDRHATGV